jgi:hypothetical protein
MKVFKLDEKQVAKLQKWLKSHDRTCEFKKEKGSTIGGRLTYRFTPTGLGVISAVHCLCGKRVDLTDSENW